jgi:carnitine O-acetyltransferase
VLVAGLQDVLAQPATGAAAGTSVGALTTQAREDWATSRQALLAAAPANRAALDVVETALLCVCLEDVVPRDTHEACDLLLHGNSANRWFDKALSFVVFADGRAGLNAEHAELDGTTILDLVDAVLAHGHDQGAGAPASAPEVRPVEFVLDAALRATVAQAEASFEAYAADTATAVLSFPNVGTDRIKALQTSPDAFVQLAYQLAHARTKGFVGATYESIATRHYRHGRTEAMRVVTPEVLAFVAAMDDPDADVRRSAFRAAAAAHVARAGQCQSGEAPEQHLWELQMLQRRRPDPRTSGPMPLYDSPGWTTMREDFLSTSSAPSRHISHFGFGSTSPQCIGIAYVLLPDRFNLYLSTPRAVAHHLEVFARELGTALVELEQLLVG